MSLTGLVERLRCALPNTSRSGAGTAACAWTGAVAPGTPLDRIPFTVFDTELTGLNMRTDHIVSVGAVRMDGSTILAGQTFYRLIRPPKPVTAESIVIHGITPDDLAGEAPAEEVMPEFLSFIADTVLVGHFVGIDVGFVNRFLKRNHGGCLRNPAIDTRRLHNWTYENSARFRRHFGGGTDKSDLFTVANRYGVEVSAAHDALMDAYLTAQLLQRLLYFARATGIRTLGELKDIGGIS